MGKNKNLDLWVHLDDEKMKLNKVPFITMAIGHDEEHIESLSQLDDEEIKKLYFSLKMAEMVIENEFLQRENDLKLIRQEIDRISDPHLS